MLKHDNLDTRLKEILQCTVCKYLPNAAIFQCPQGHLICIACFTAILRVGPLEAPCPQPKCGALLCKARTARNVAAEKIVQELPTECRFCSQPMPRRLQYSHERDLCHMRPTTCYYRVIGCTWRGPHMDYGSHEAACPWPRKPGAELLKALQLSDQLALQDRRQYDRVFDLLCSEAISFEDIELISDGKPCQGQECLESCTFEAFRNTWMVQARVEEQLERPKLNYQGCHTFESSLFCAFNNTWVVQAKCCFRRPLSTIPDLSYQLVLKSKKDLPCEVSFCMLQGPLGDLKVNPIINKHYFRAENDVSSNVALCFTDSSLPFSADSTSFFNFRIVMFLTAKTVQETHL